MKTVWRTLPVILVSATATAPTANAEQPLGSGDLTQTTPSLRAHLSERLDFRARISNQSGTLSSFEHTNTSYSSSVPPARHKAEAFVDWDMGIGGLRMTGGALQSSLDDEAPVTTHRRASAEEQARFDESWRPYLGVGWDSSVASGSRSRLDIKLDLGLMFESGASETDQTADGASLLNENALLKEEFESFQYSPTFSADLEYRF